MKFESPKNINYCAVVVELKESNFITLDNCDNIKGCII